MKTEELYKIYAKIAKSYTKGDCFYKGPSDSFYLISEAIIIDIRDNNLNGLNTKIFYLSNNNNKNVCYVVKEGNVYNINSAELRVNDKVLIHNLEFSNKTPVGENAKYKNKILLRAAIINRL